jgi:hypothetical protein
VVVANAILTATARVTPSKLRGQEDDHMGEIMAAVAEQRAKLASTH